MIIHYLKIAWRNIWNDKVYSLINLVGLTVAFTVVLLFVQWIRFELSYENSNPNANRIYMVQEVEKRPDGYFKHKIKRSGVDNALKTQYPIIEDGIFMSIYTSSVELKQESFLYTAALAPFNFFHIFPMQIIAGSDAYIENRRGGVFISEQFAKKVYGNPENAVDMEFARYKDDEKKRFDGVVRVPENSVIQFDILYLTTSDIEWGVNYIMLRKSVSFTEEQQRTMGKYPAEYGSDRRFIFEPIKRIHLYSDDQIVSASTSGSSRGKIREVRTFGWIVVLILLLAVINYVNTSTARAMNRSKEVIVRKISGSQSMQLMTRFLMESLIISLIAVFLALDIAKLLHHPFENVIGNSFTFRFDAVTLLLTLLIALITTILSGGYAAFYLSSINPSRVIRVAVKSKLRYILMSVQFAISIGVLICTWTVYRQLNYMLTKDLGFNRENVYFFNTSLMYESEEFITELQQSPYVLNATMASAAPYSVEREYDRVNWLDAPPEIREKRIVELSCDQRFVDVFGLQLLQGEFIPSGLPWGNEENESTHVIVVNESFKKMMGVDNPLGMMVEYGESHVRRRGKIIGVVRDFYFRPMNNEISPLIISFNPEVSGRMYIRIDPGHEKEALQHIRDTYDKMRTNMVLLSTRPFILTSLETEYRQIYKAETRLQEILGIFSLLSIVLSFMGVVGMVIFLIEKRSKEISIRKINGAKWFDIVKQFWREFLLLIGMASALAVVSSVWFMDGWLQQYVYRPPFGWWIFIVVPLFMAVFTALILFLQVYGIARQNPVKNLRSE